MMESLKKCLLGILLILSLLINIPGILIGLLCGVSVFLLGKLIRDDRVTKLGWNQLIGQDQAANSMTGGDPDETISSRTGKLMDSRPWAKALAWFLALFERDHAEKAIEEDEGDDSVVE